MADSEIAGLTEDTTPDSTDNVYAQSSDGNTDKRVPLSALPISTATQTALDLKAPLASPTFTGTVSLPDDTVANAKLANMAEATIKGRAASAGTGDPTDLTASQARTAMGLGTAAVVDTGTSAGNVPLNSDLRDMTAGTRTSINLATAGQVAVDVDLATGIAGGDTLSGGSAASETLTLASTSHATQGTVNLRDKTLLISEDKTFSTTTVTQVLFDVNSSRTLTFSSATAAGNQYIGHRQAAALTFAATSGTNAVQYVQLGGSVQNDTTSRTINVINGVSFSPTIRADTGTVTHNTTNSFRSAPTFSIANGGTMNATGHYGFVSSPQVATGATVTSLVHFSATAATITGTVTEQIGVQIGLLTGATTNIGLQNLSTTQNIPSVVTITAVSDAIAVTTTNVRLNNTSGSSKTLTSTPTIADGVNGQEVTLINTGASDVVIQDQGTLASSNLRLTATSITLSTRDSVKLTYSSTVGDWLQTGPLVNVL